MPQSTTQVFNSVLNALSDGVLRFALCVDIKTFICRIVIGDRIVISQQINIAGYLGASKVNEKGYYRKMFKQGGYPPCSTSCYFTVRCLHGANFPIKMNDHNFVLIGSEMITWNGNVIAWRITCLWAITQAFLILNKWWARNDFNSPILLSDWHLFKFCNWNSSL